MKKIINYSPIIAILTGAIIISFSGVWVKLADVSPTSSSFYRVFFGFLFLLIPSIQHRDFSISSKKQGSLIGLCALIFAADLIFWHSSIGYIGPGLATMLGNFQVFMLAAIGILFLGEAIRLRFLLSIPLAVFGLYLIVGNNWQNFSHDYSLGIYLGLATAACYTGFLLTLRKIQSNSTISFYNTLMWVSFACSVILGIIMIFTGETFSIPNIKSFLSLLALGLFSQTIGWLLITNSITKIRASLAGLILLLQPTLAFIWDVLFFNRPTDLTNWIGVLLTMFAIYLGVSSKKKD